MAAHGTPLNDAWEQRLRVYPVVLLVALSVAFLFVLLSGTGSTTATGRIGGDFPAFYGAGTIVADGDIDRLYEPIVQEAAQAGLLGDEDGFIMYPYAPHVAAAYSPLSAVPYRLAYVAHTAVMIGALVGALSLLRPVVPILRNRVTLATAASMTTYPVFVGMTGGQNTALSLLLIAVAWRAWHEDRDDIAGLALALLLFRPQYALPLLGLALLDRRFRTLATAAVGAGLVWIANAALVGPGWITTWYDGVRPLLEADAEVNAMNEIAPIGVLVALFGESTVAVGAGAAVSTAIVVGLMALWWRRPIDLHGRMAITTAALTLLGPHAIYYDSSLLIFSVVVLADRRQLSPTGIALLWASGLLHLARHIADVSPLIIVVFTVLGLTVTRLTGRSGHDDELPDRVLPIQDSYSV